MISTLYSCLFGNSDHVSADAPSSSQGCGFNLCGKHCALPWSSSPYEQTEQLSKQQGCTHFSPNPATGIEGASNAPASQYYYSCGYQDALEEYAEKARKLEEEKQSLLDLEQEMRSIFDSYVNKAACELKRINGEELCDAYLLKQQISVVKQDVQFLRSLVSTLRAEFVHDLNEQQNRLESLFAIIRNRDNTEL